MKTIEELLKNLARPEVLEFGLVTNRLPSVNIGGKFEPVDDEAPSNERLMAMLVTMGGSRYVDSLSDKPVQWTTKLEGVGVIAVAAILRKDIVQARFTVAKREGGPPSVPQRAASAAPTQPQGKPPVPSAGTAKPATPSARAIPAAQATGASSAAKVPAARPAAAAPTSAQMTAAKSTQQLASQAVKNAVPSTTARAGQPASAAAMRAASSAAAAPAPSPPAPPVAPPPASSPTTATTPPQPEEEWDDDDEPTLQTLSPPVVPPHLAAEAKAKPARRPDVAAAEEKAAAEKAAAEKAAAEKAATEKVAAEKAAADKAAAEKTAREKAAAEKAAAEKAAADKTAAEKAAAEKAAAEKAAAEKAENERAEQARIAREAEERAEQERIAREEEERAERERIATAEKAAAEERAAAEAAARRPATPPRRINTPTTIEAVDVEITTTQSGAAKNVVHEDADGNEDTVSLPGGVDVARASQQAEAQAKARGPVPTTTAPNIPERDRPRVESSAAIDSFLAMAIAARATDLIIIAGRPVLLRVATDLLPRTQAIPVEQVDRIAKEIVPARLRETLEKEGSCDFAVEHLTHGRFRVNVSRQRSGMKLTLRVVSKEMPSLASLGLPETIAKAVEYRSGLALIAGPAGHGKSSTLAALIDQINRESARHVATIEEPIENVHPRKKGLVSQRDVGLHTRNKAKAFHSALRSDPDVLAISELRDGESIRQALSVAEGGRLVLATINAPNASVALERMLRPFAKSDEHWARTTLAATLRLVIAQQLVPSADRTRLHAAVELVPASLPLWSALRAGRIPEISVLKGKSRGVILLDESLADLVRTQKVTVEVAKHYSEAPSEFEALVARRK